MQPCLRQYADYFSICILLGFCSVNEVIVWADRLIEERDCPSDWIIELSTSASKHLLDIIHLLDLVPGTKDLDISFRLAIAKLGYVYPILLPEQGRFIQPDRSRLLSRLYFLAREHEELSDDVSGNISQIYFDMDYVEEGGDWSIIQQDYEELLAVGNNYKQWIDII